MFFPEPITDAVVLLYNVKLSVIFKGTPRMFVTFYVPPAILRGMAVVWTREEVFGLMRNLVLDKRGNLTLRLLMSYIYGAPILDVSRSHTTTHHSR